MATRPTERLSKDPAQVRMRLRRRGHDIERDIAILYKKPIEDWDLEELARGKPRNKKGNFSGRTPGWITPAIMKESRRRLMEGTFGELAGFADIALQVLKNLMESTEVDVNGRPLVDAKTKLAASTYVLDHIVGKPKAIVELQEARDNQKMALAAAIVLDDGQPQGHLTKVIDGDFEVVEDDEEDGEEV